MPATKTKTNKITNTSFNSYNSQDDSNSSGFGFNPFGNIAAYQDQRSKAGKKYFFVLLNILWIYYF